MKILIFAANFKKSENNKSFKRLDKTDITTD